MSFTLPHENTIIDSDANRPACGCPVPASRPPTIPPVVYAAEWHEPHIINGRYATMDDAVRGYYDFILDSDDPVDRMKVEFTHARLFADDTGAAILRDYYRGRPSLEGAIMARFAAKVATTRVLSTAPARRPHVAIPLSPELSRQSRDFMDRVFLFTSPNNDEKEPLPRQCQQLDQSDLIKISDEELGASETARADRVIGLQGIRFSNAAMMHSYESDVIVFQLDDVLFFKSGPRLTIPVEKAWRWREPEVLPCLTMFIATYTYMQSLEQGEVNVENMTAQLSMLLPQVVSFTIQWANLFCQERNPATCSDAMLVYDLERSWMAFPEHEHPERTFYAISATMAFCCVVGV